MDVSCLMLTLVLSIAPGTDASPMHLDTASMHSDRQSAVADERQPTGLKALDEELGMTGTDGFLCVDWGGYGLAV